MNRSLSLGIAIASVVASAMSAQAADLPGRSNSPSYYKAPSELPFSWTGFYAGINGGYAWGQSSWSDPAVGADSGNFNTSGGLVGGQLGYNWHDGTGLPIVAKLSADQSAGGIEISRIHANCRVTPTRLAPGVAAIDTSVEAGPTERQLRWRLVVRR